MRPGTAGTIPASNALPGGVRYEIKLDGFRCLAFAQGGRPPVLQSRSGRNLSPEFPGIAAAVGQLPAGLVLDGELVAWKQGRLAFEVLLRSRRARAADPEVTLALVVFDVLAIPGRDVRKLPLSERVVLLENVMVGVPPEIQLVLSTTDTDEATQWYEVLQAQGVEGLVCKGLSTPYEPRGSARKWLKVRFRDTLDAEIIGFTGTPGRPRALLLRLADGSEVYSSPVLDAPQARSVAAALVGRIGQPVAESSSAGVHPVAPPVSIEVLAGVGRHATYRYMRVRGD